jgi:hypothetical protein
MVRHAGIVALLASASAVVACGGSEEPPFSVSPRHAEPARARVPPSNTGAPSADTGVPPADTGAPPPGGDFPDITFELGTKVAPATEAQKCLFVQVPADRGTIAVPSAESHFTPGSHHFLAYRTGLDELPAQYPGVVDCFETLGGVMQFVSGSYYEAQQPDMHHDLPEGVAHLFQPGEVILLQAHYLNTSLDELDAKVEFTLHTMDPGAVEHEAGSILFSNFLLNIPPLSKVTETRSCPVSTTTDMNVSLLWSHMHRRAVHFIATTDDPAVDGPLYESNDWNEPKARDFADGPPTIVHAGNHITYSCDFDNTTSKTFTYGPSADTNEMCILHGMYWPRVDAATEGCLLGSSN